MVNKGRMSVRGFIVGLFAVILLLVMMFGPTFLFTF